MASARRRRMFEKSIQEQLHAEIIQTAAEEDRCCFAGDRKSTRLNSSHQIISYAVFCLKKKKNRQGVVAQSEGYGFVAAFTICVGGKVDCYNLTEIVCMMQIAVMNKW